MSESELGALNIVVENIELESQGHKLLGRVYRPNAPGRFPAVVLCHGYPGDNKNMDLAEEVALNGFVVLIFYYPGAWGSGGTFSLRGLDTSSRDAIEYLISQPFVDSDRVGVIGYSMGAVPVAKRLSVDSRLRTGIFISPAADLSFAAREEAFEASVSIFLRMGKDKLRGLSADVLKSELPWIIENLNPVETIRDAKAPIMVIVGSEDTVVPPESCKALFEAANEPRKWILIDGADHGYSEHRIPLINSVLQWLKDNL